MSLLEPIELFIEAICLVMVGLAAVPILSTAYQFLAIPFHAFRNHYGKAAPNEPRVTVIIPAWNEGMVIGASIDRLMALDYPRDRLRIYVVDDASVDDTPLVVQEKALAYPGSVYHLRREQGGQGKAHTLNHGIRIALQDEWMQALLIMDADVIYEPTSLRRMTRHLADPEVGAVTAYIREGSADKNYLTRFIGFEYVLAQLAARRAQNVLGALACLAGGAQLHSRENLEAIGGAIDTSTLAEDTITTFKSQLLGRRVVFEPHAVVLAEEPQLVASLWKQRLRWARGNVHVTSMFRKVWFRPSKDHKLGTISFGVLWFSILLLPAAMVLSTVGLIGLLILQSDLATTVFRLIWVLAACVYIYSIFFALQMDPETGRRSWLEAVLYPGLVSIGIMVAAFFPALFNEIIPDLFDWRVTEELRFGWSIFVYSWISFAMVGAWVARAVEPTKVGKFLTPFLIYVVGYGPLLCAVTLDSYIKEFRHAEARWDKTEKTGRVIG